MAISLKEALARTQPMPRLDEAVLEGRAELLDSFDRQLLLAAWLHNQPAARLAELTGRSPRVLRRRLRRILRHLHSRAFVEAARALPMLKGDQAAVARLHLLQMRSARQTARAAGLSYHRVRRLLDEVRAIIQARSSDPQGRSSAPGEWRCP